MNKNQIVFVAGMAVAGLTGIISTWYAGRKSYKQGVQDGIDATNKMVKVRDEMIEKSFRERIKS